MAKLYEFVTATLTVNFSDSSASTGGASIKLEVDDRTDGSNGGETSFKPGDTVGILQFIDGNVEIGAGYPQASAGGITPYSGFDGNKIIDENITFSNSDTANIGYPPLGTVDMQWMGRVVELNAKTGVVTPYSGELPDVSFSSLSLKGGKKVIGVLRCKYTAQGECFKLTVDKQTAIDLKEVLVFSIGQVVSTV